MAARKRARRARSSHGAAGLVALLLATSLLTLVTPVAASPATDDLSIEAGMLPIADVHYDFNELVFPEVSVKNDLTSNADGRQIKAAICSGDRTATQTCPAGGGTQEAMGQVPNLGPKETTVVRFNTLFFFPSTPGVHTVVFWFPATDIDDTDDRLAYTFSYDQPLRDLIVNDHDVDTEVVYNSGDDIEASLDMAGRSWIADQSFTVGWSMHLIEPLVAEAEDCVDWQMNYTGTGDMQGNEIILHEFTPHGSTSEIHHAPYDLRLELSNTSTQIQADIAVPGTEFGVDHAIEINATVDGVVVDTTWFNFTGDGSLQEETLWLNFANGTICYTARMTVPDIQVASASHEVGGIDGSFNSRWIVMPNISAPFPGEFEVRAGVSNAFMDANDHNDMLAFDLIVDDTVNLWIREVVPARGVLTYTEVDGNTVARFPYGEQSIRVVAGNIGWKPATTEIEINLLDYASGVLSAGPYTCAVSMLPGEETRCDFDFATTGMFRLNASIQTTDGGIDVDDTDNWFEIGMIVQFGNINPVIANPVANSIYETGETILAVAGVDPLAPMPLNFTWKMNYVEVLGYGQTANLTMPMGEWLLTVYVSDEADNLEIAETPVRIHNRVDFNATPWIPEGHAISTTPMELAFDEPQLPPAGVMYPVAFNKGKDPLMMFNLSMAPTMGTELELESLTAWLDLGAFLPPTINISTVELLRVEDWNTTILHEFDHGDHYTIHTNGSLDMDLSDDGGGSFMLIGALDPVVVNPAGLDIILQKEGQVRIAWSNEGDAENPYFGGWRVYRKTTLTFAYPFTSQAQFNSATLGYHVANLPPAAEGWQDPTYHEQGTCVSYLVMAHTRAGIVDWHFGNVTGGVWNEITQRMDVPEICVDDSPPTAEVLAMKIRITFDNTSKLHSTNLSWTWPELDEQGPLTWNLYRAQSVVTDVEFMEPVEVGIVPEAGVKAYHNETEGFLREDIKLEQFYYYVLVPFDAVGNSDYLVRPGNAKGIALRDQFWNFHQEPPPPPPPPPPELPFFGPSEWYGRLLEDLEQPRFQQAAMVAFAVLALNLLLLPVMINRLRRNKRMAARAKAKAAKQAELMSADEFADEFDDFFD